MFSDQTTTTQLVYKKLSEDHCNTKPPRFNRKDTMKYVVETRTNTTNMRPAQRLIKEQIGYPLFQSKAVIEKCLKMADLQSAKVIKLPLELTGSTQEKVVTKDFPIYYVGQLTEAYNMNLLENINSGKFCIPDGMCDDYITLHWGGDLGKGHTQCSISTATRKHNNSVKNSVVTALWENPASDSYRNLSKIFGLVGKEQFGAIASRPMINFIVTNQKKSKPLVHVSMMTLNTFGRKLLSETLDTYQAHQEWKRSAPPPHDNMLSKMKHEFLLETPQAHYSVNKNLNVLSSDWLLSDVLSNAKIMDWRSFCNFDSSGKERLLWLSTEAQSILGDDFDGIISVKHKDFIVCQLRVRTYHDGVKLPNCVWFLGGDMIYPYVDLRKVSNPTNSITYLDSKEDSFKLLKQQYLPYFHDKTEYKLFCWFSMPAQLKVCGDLAFLSKLLGHGGQSCKYPCYLCTVTSDMIKSVDNAENPDFGVWKLRNNCSVFNNFAKKEYQEAKLTETCGIKYLPLLPIYPWMIELSGFHIFEGLMARLQAAKMFFLESQTELSKDDEEIVDQIAILKTKRLNLLNNIEDLSSFEKSVAFKEYGTEDVDCDLDLDVAKPHWLREARKIQVKLHELYRRIAPNTALRKVIEWEDDHKLIQHEYRPGSVNGAVLKANIKHYVGLAAIIRTEFDSIGGTHLGDDWESIMADYEKLHGFICKIGSRLSDEQMKELKECNDRFNGKYYRFLIKYGEPPKGANAENTVNCGIKIHFLKHLMESIECNDNTRSAYTNEERVEAMVQFMHRLIAPYLHFFGERRMWAVSRRANVSQLLNVWYEDNWIVNVPEDAEIGGEQLEIDTNDD